MEQHGKFECEMIELLREIRGLVSGLYFERQRLRIAAILIVFSPSTKNATGENFMTPLAPIAGPVILTTAGEVATASVLGFDQFGNPWTGTIPPVTFTSSDTAGAVITSVPNNDGLTALVSAVADGTASLTATLTTAEGLSLSDTETVTVAIGPPDGTPVLTSIKVAFA